MGIFRMALRLSRPQPSVSSRATFSGACAPQRVAPATVAQAKKGIHGDWYPEAEVYCNGELVMTVGGTKERYDVELWSGNHPFFQGKKNTTIISETGNLKKFQNKFGGGDSDDDSLSFLCDIDALSGADEPA